MFYIPVRPSDKAIYIVKYNELRERGKQKDREWTDFKVSRLPELFHQNNFFTLTN